MSYPWTRVPVGDPPSDRLQERLVPVADLFMALMWSRPHGLSLRSAWVTPATIWLASAVCVVSLPAAVVTMVVATTSGSIVLGLGGLGCLLVATGSAIVALFGIRQRLLR